MPKLCAHTKCQWVVAIVSIISSRSESRQTRSLILCNASVNALWCFSLLWNEIVVHISMSQRLFIYRTPVHHLCHTCVFFIWKWCWHTYYTLHFTHTQRLMYVCLHKQASKKPMATALVYILHKHHTHTFVCCAKWNEIILSVARKNILLHKMGQVTNLNNRVKCARGIKAPSWRCLCVCVYACVIHTLIRALRTRVRQLFFCCCCCSHWWNIIVRTS